MCYEEEVVRKVITTSSEVITTSGKDSFTASTSITTVVKTDCGSKSCPQSASYEPPLASNSSSTSSDTTNK
ncbi:hypothetical protein NCU17285 [Neurospora crassa OR74A]|uniref:Uncharacterized protein n=1 Tax=Neurospora crassa (strain ATCC 24698 / 74-OR23-1A / CBS 708.71 / DSM 1257 / FGSC 987) TaxID=367110 RepID=V5IKR7_NEUCR|nr:hypothetical protein NCU17285 [Neurospora crassa OR74A]ESA42082.1 hypothetical protein NCU17285 [Neurospora crassa OR74A]|eukprot:XP_011395403.1 hypothetical protein NCU17285 [Neurospora crassa OR74A]